MNNSAILIPNISVVDSHTAGEPTRVVLDGGPDLGSGSFADRLRRFATSFDDFRSAVIHEPRGSDVLVGALLSAPADSRCVAGVLFFNNVGYLGMCGHGTIGVVSTLAHLGRISSGEHWIETPVGVVKTVLHEDGRVTVENVASYRHRQRVAVDVPGKRTVIGDVAWGGNWFFLAEETTIKIDIENHESLTSFAVALRRALRANDITGADGAEIDHIELFSNSPTADSRNFVLCPGNAYDRSPCGTGTSAKLACLAADGKLAPDQIWRQEGILGTTFEGSYRMFDDSLDRIIPSITGSAFITAESKLLLHPYDPFRAGIRPSQVLTDI